jgi:hypothetical protein
VCVCFYSSWTCTPYSLEYSIKSSSLTNQVTDLRVCPPLIGHRQRSPVTSWIMYMYSTIHWHGPLISLIASNPISSHLTVDFLFSLSRISYGRTMSTLRPDLIFPQREAPVNTVEPTRQISKCLCQTWRVSRSCSHYATTITRECA